MPQTSRPITLVCGTRSLGWVDLDRYLSVKAVGEVVGGSSSGVDACAEAWAKRHGVEWVCYLPQNRVYGAKYAPQKLDEEMVAFCDQIAYFWDGKPDERLERIKSLAVSWKVPMHIHIIEDLD